ncbi:MAG: transcriptional repressor [Candidatus Eisenbacteria bacterium]
MRDHGTVRMTESRKAILSALCTAGVHPTADEVYLTVREELPKVSLGTVYRNLDLLTNQGLIRTLTAAGEPRRYDGTLDEHHHITCEVCGRVDDVELSCSEPLEELLVDRGGYEVRGYTLRFMGVCGECAGNGKDHEEKGKGEE